MTAVFKAAVVFFALVLALRAEQTNAPARPAAASRDEAAVGVAEEMAALRAENEALRRENQFLRRELVVRKGVAPDTLLPAKVVNPGESFTPPAEDTGFWLSSKSKIRHNRRCRNYRKVKGRPCGPSDGKPCKICGG